MTRTTTLLISSEGSPNGGFSTSTSTFGSQPTTGNKTWLTGSGTGPYPGTGDSLYLSSDDSDTYDGGTKKYGWFRGIVRDLSAGLGTVMDGFYYGGYIPFDVTNDTDPFLMLGGKPWLGTNSVPADDISWGNLINTNSNCRVPVENGLAISSLVSLGHAGLSANRYASNTNRSKTRNGTQVEMQVYVHGLNSQCLGYLGPNTMVAVAEDITNWSTNTAGTRIKINSFGHAWV